LTATPATDVASADQAEAAVQAPARNLSQRIVSGGAWSIAGRLASVGSLFLMNVVLAHALRKNEYAAFLAAAAVIPFLSMLASVGVPYTVVRALRGQIAGSQDRTAILRGALIVTLIGCGVTAIGFVVATRAFPDEPKWQLLRNFPELLSAWFSLSALCILGAYFLQGLDDFRSAALIGARSGGVIPNIIALAATAAAAALGALTLALVISAQVAGFVAATAWAAIMIPPLLSAAKSPEPGPAQSNVNSPTAAYYSPGWYFVESWPNLINQLVAVALIEMDLFWVTCLAPEGVVADYGVVRSLRVLVPAPLLIASIALAPFVAELYGKGDIRRLERMLRGTATVIAAPSLVALAALLIAPELVIRWTFGNAFLDAATALRIACVGCIIFVISGSNGLVLTMTGRHRDLMACSLFSLGLYLAISPLMIARYGVAGAALAFTLQIAVQNIIVTLRVKQAVGVWTIPLLSPGVVLDEAVQLRRRLAAR
jgi:O-antigen/teichoic acid export membrane protein